MECSLPLLTVHPSRCLSAVMVALHLAALAAAWLTALPVWAGLGLTGLVGISLYVTLRARPSVALRGQSDNLLAFVAGGEPQSAVVLPESLVFPWLVVIRYRLDGHHRKGALVLLSDSLAKVDFRRLRIWLRWQASVSGGDDKMHGKKDAGEVV